ncbi:hypothetical protein [Enterobacter cloacae]|uniref:hypothetical protein n=1 Tax=Enterobacter cloacae TaxID=550 RepID=UPI0013EEA684|nr:hypothetical protein [Enterobacter cloacae]
MTMNATVLQDNSPARPAEQTAVSGDLVKCTFTVQVFSLVFRSCFAVRHPVAERDHVKHPHILFPYVVEKSRPPCVCFCSVEKEVTDTEIWKQSKNLGHTSIKRIIDKAFNL